MNSSTYSLQERQGRRKREGGRVQGGHDGIEMRTAAEREKDNIFYSWPSQIFGPSAAFDSH